MESPVLDRSASPPVRPTHTAHRGLPVPAAVSITLLGAFLVGILTSVGQGGPDFLSSLSNSAGSWFLATVLLLLVVRPRMRWALPLGVVVLELMHVGYTVASNLRGHPDFLAITNFWVLMAVPAGLLAGAVANWVLRGGPRLRAFASGLAGAVLVGEGISALLRVAATTSVAFWIAEIVVGVLVVVTGVVAGRTPAGRVVGLGTGVVGAAAVFTAYMVVG
ncbi:DUF6518 family protein [Curtobacterium sp. RRHDQ10]|uniref:DUF6518 family protein n=1 Tax=Curtobacterium phyllosphaerae TaxID=3413379 RepID=UPI003BF3F2AD